MSVRAQNVSHGRVQKLKVSLHVLCSCSTTQKHLKVSLLQQISVLQDEGGCVEESQLPAEPQHAAPPPIQPASTSGPHLRAGVNMCCHYQSLARGDCSHQGHFRFRPPLLCMLCFA